MTRPADRRVHAIDADFALDLVRDGAPGLLDLLRDRGLILIELRNGQAERDFTEVVSALGSTVSHPFLPSQDAAGISELRREEDAVGGFIYGGAWHQNLAFLEQPPDITALLASDIATDSNFTAFVDLAEVEPWLSDGFRNLLKSIRGIHSTEAPMSPQRVLPQMKGADFSGSAVHAGYQSDPATGRSWPFITSNYVTNFVGWNARESMPIVDALSRFAIHDEFVIRHYWRKGDLLLWDNRRYIHRATVTHFGGERVMRRADIRAGWGLAGPSVPHNDAFRDADLSKHAHASVTCDPTGRR